MGQVAIGLNSAFHDWLRETVAQLSLSNHRAKEGACIAKGTLSTVTEGKVSSVTTTGNLSAAEVLEN